MKLAEWGLTRKAHSKRTKERSASKKEVRRRRHVEERESDGDVEAEESDSTVRGASRERRRHEDLSPGEAENLETLLLSRATTHMESMDTGPIDPNLTLFDENGE
jgi:TATA-binding protein-associated factor Taf7